MKNKIYITLFALTTFVFAAACESPNNANANRSNTVTNSTTNVNSMSNTMTNSNAMSNANAVSNSTNPMVGGAEMLATRDIVENASNSKDHTTLVAAVKAADLVDTLKGAGPFTVFAPTNAAFDKLPDGTVDTLLKPENKDQLKAVLTYHVVPGKQDAAAVTKAIKDGNGKATFKTVNGAELTATLEGDKVVLTDAKGGKSTVTTADVMQSNGVIHVVDSVLLPK